MVSVRQETGVRPRRAAEFVEYTGPARLDRRTKLLVRRVVPGDIAIVDHTDLDRVSAEELIDAGVRVVVNVAESQTGRFPNPGPLTLVQGGVRLIDAPGADLFDTVAEGDVLTVRAGGLYRGSERVASGHVLRADELRAALAEQRTRVTDALGAFADNTMRFLRDESRLLAEGIDFPAIETRFRDRHALVVARGPGPQARPADGQAVHPRLPAGARRRGRRRRRAARGRLQAARDRRRHGLGLGPGAARPARRWSCTRTRTGRRRARRAARSSACGTTSCRRPA